MRKREDNLVLHIYFQVKCDNCGKRGKFVEKVMKVDDVGTMPYIVQNEY